MNDRLILVCMLLAALLVAGCSAGSPADNAEGEPPVGQEDTPTTETVTEADTSETTSTDTEAAPTNDDTGAASTSQPTVSLAETPTGGEPQATPPAAADAAASGLVADVISVEVTGQEGAYQFVVGIASPDEGCSQYADWWEVLDEEGNLLYRRILAHSHVSEQPFVRSGGPMEIAPDTVVWVRAHMDPGGYGGTAFTGSVASGFEQVELSSDFAAEVETMEPQPSGCAF